MKIELAEATVKLGERLANTPDGKAVLRNHITSALATLRHDDLDSLDAWENLVYDLECALATANAMAKQVLKACSYP